MARRMLAAVAAGSFLCAGAAPSSMQGVNAVPSCSVVFVSPHQDDEVLSMGAAILSEVAARGPERVCVVLFTTGAHSGVREAFARSEGVVQSNGGGKYVNDALTVPGRFARARDREFMAATQAMGVPARNVFVDGMPRFLRVFDHNTWAMSPRDRVGLSRTVDIRAAGGGVYAPVNQGAADRLMWAIHEAWGRVDVHTTSPCDFSADHAALGIAASRLRDRFGEVAFYAAVDGDDLAARPAWACSDTAHRPPLRVVPSPDVARSAAAAAEYGRLDRRGDGEGRYGIGWLSVPRAFGGPALTSRTCPHGHCGPPTSPLPRRDGVSLVDLDYASRRHNPEDEHGLRTGFLAP